MFLTSSYLHLQLDNGHSYGNKCALLGCTCFVVTQHTHTQHKRTVQPIIDSRPEPSRMPCFGHMGMLATCTSVAMPVTIKHALTRSVLCGCWVVWTAATAAAAAAQRTLRYGSAGGCKRCDRHRRKHLPHHDDHGMLQTHDGGHKHAQALVEREELHQGLAARAATTCPWPLRPVLRGYSQWCRQWYVQCWVYFERPRHTAARETRDHITIMTVRSACLNHL